MLANLDAASRANLPPSADVVRTAAELVVEFGQFLGGATARRELRDGLRALRHDVFVPAIDDVRTAIAQLDGAEAESWRELRASAVVLGDPEAERARLRRWLIALGAIRPFGPPGSTANARLGDFQRIDAEIGPPVELWSPFSALARLELDAEPIRVRGA